MGIARAEIIADRLEPGAFPGLFRMESKTAGYLFPGSTL
jgi:hypothetical protein